MKIDGLRVALAVVAFERVLHRPRGGQHDAALALELLLDRDALARAVHQPARERAAEAAVEQQHDPARAALRHLAVDELGRDRGRLEVLDGRVRAGEVERAVLVLEPVAGDVEQEQVVAAAVGEELGQLAAHDVVGLVERDADLEVADLRSRRAREPAPAASRAGARSARSFWSS